jgi:hypothetical protein
MNTLVVQTKDKYELKLVTDLLRKMHINSKVLKSEDLEDMGLAKLMKQADRKQTVSREDVMGKLSIA